MTTIPDLGQAHETCFWVKLVRWVKKKIKENKAANDEH